MNPPASAAGGEYAILTSGGPAAIAVVRLRGPGVPRFLTRHLPHAGAGFAREHTPGTVRRDVLRDADGAALDDVLVTIHALAPRWDVRVHLHGNPHLVQHVAALAAGCGLVDTPPGNLWSCADALEADLVERLPHMLTWRGTQWLLRQGSRLRREVQALAAGTDIGHMRNTCAALAARANRVDWFARPLRVVLLGPTNAGKSTLANALADQSVSLVSPIAGTTRDWIEFPAEAAGFPLVYVDTAGLRESGDPLEGAGAARTLQQAAQADALVVVLDRSAAAANHAFAQAYSGPVPDVIFWNKSDLPADAVPAPTEMAEWGGRHTHGSALQRRGLVELGAALLAAQGREVEDLDAPAPFAPRQVESLRAAEQATDEGFMRTLLLGLVAGGVRATGTEGGTLADPGR